MTHVSAPQPADIVQANARDLRQSVGEVHSDVLPLFGAVAEEMIADMGAVPALCAAMAVACGHTKPLPAKSLLTSLEGFKTFTLALEDEQAPMAETRAVFPLLRKVLPQACVASIKGLRLFLCMHVCMCIGAAAGVRGEHQGAASLPATRPGHGVCIRCPRG